MHTGVLQYSVATLYKGNLNLRVPVCQIIQSKNIFSREQLYFLWELFLVFRCIYGCQKWIPEKILHRYDNSIFFSTHFFSIKNFTLKIEKYFLGKFSKFSENHFFSKEKSDFPSMIFENFQNFEISPQNIFFHFQSEIFVKKNELRKKLNYHFDVENCQESFFGIHNCNRPCLVMFWGLWKKATIFRAN